MSYEPQSFGFETTNSVAFQDFKFAQPERVSKIVPFVNTVQTKAPTGHFVSTHKKELNNHSSYRPPRVDAIPYP
jgi:hypothetical protein